MPQSKKYIGIDLHSDNFYVHYLTDEDESEDLYRLDDIGILDFIKTIHKKDEIAIEASGNTLNFVKKIEPFVSSIKIVPPNKFSVIGRSIQKTDAKDAQKLALFLSKGLLPDSRRKEEIYIRILSLAETRFILRKAKSALINKLHSVMLQNGHKLGKHKINRGRFDKYVYAHDFNDDVLEEIQFLEKEITHLKNSMDELEARMIDLTKRTKYFEAVRGITGIGDLSACTLIGVIGNIDDFSSPSKLASYFGIVPKVRISNATRKNSTITKAGNRLGRSTLIQCTWIAIRHNESLRRHYEKLSSRKPNKKAVIATSRKLLKTVYNTMHDCN